MWLLVFALIFLVGCVGIGVDADTLRAQGYQRVPMSLLSAAGERREVLGYELWAKEGRDAGRQVSVCLVPRVPTASYRWWFTVYVDGKATWTYDSVEVRGFSSQAPSTNCTTTPPLPEGQLAYRAHFTYQPADGPLSQPRAAPAPPAAPSTSQGMPPSPVGGGSANQRQGRVALRADSPTETSVPIKVVGKIILVQAEINGFPPVVFVLDTGASVTVLNAAVAQRLGVAIPPIAPNVDLNVVGGRTISVPLARVKTVKVGEFIVEDMDVGIFEAFPDAPEVAGLLGADFLHYFTVTIDRQAGRLILAVPSGPDESASTEEPTSPVAISCPKGAIWTGKGCIAEEVISKDRPPPPSQPDALPSPAQEAAKAPIWEEGDEWRYRWASPRGSGTFFRSVIREEVIEGIGYYVLRSGSREIYYSKNELAWLMERERGGVEERASPAWRRFAWPLVVGKEWETTYTWENPRERSTEDRFRRLKVEALETVTVPAGTFRAFHVIVKDRVGAITYEYWYAPEVKWVVKEKTLFSDGIRERELLEYRLKSATTPSTPAADPID